MYTDHLCFCELAPLYALDLLEAQERCWVEQQIENDADLAAELSELQATVETIAYTATAVPISSNLKQRLFQRLDIATTGDESPTFTELSSPELETASEEIQLAIPVYPPSLPFAVQSQDLVWQPHRVPGVMIARLHVDTVKHEVVGLFRAEAGVRYPLHRHAGVEEIFMLQGDLVIAGKVYGSGDYIRSEPGSIHAPETTGGCMFFFRTSCDDEYFE
ncbi:MAG: cupin domain-containing protein [Nostocaceae cyanobacterium]|nr:cupin domain-containing protein [Nostocaceae cyanobacterium]